MAGRLRQPHFYKTLDPSLRQLWKIPYQPTQTSYITSLSLRLYSHLPSFLPCTVKALLPSEAPFSLHRSFLHYGPAHPILSWHFLLGFHPTQDIIFHSYIPSMPRFNFSRSRTVLVVGGKQVVFKMAEEIPVSTSICMCLEITTLS